MHHEELREILADLGVSQACLARTLGVTRRAVVFWMAGGRRIPAETVRAVRLAKRRGYWTSPRGGDDEMAKKPKGKPKGKPKPC